MTQTQTLTVLPCTSDDVSICELRQSFPCQIQSVSSFVDQLMSFITQFKDGSETDIEMALIEALENAVVHGNCEDHQKRVCVTCRCTVEGEVSITVQDEVWFEMGGAVVHMCRKPNAGSAAESNAQ